MRDMEEFDHLGHGVDFADQSFLNESDGESLFANISNSIRRHKLAAGLSLSLLALGAFTSYKNRVPIKEAVNQSVNYTCEASSNFLDSIQGNVYNVLFNSPESAQASEEESKDLSEVNEILESEASEKKTTPVVESSTSSTIYDFETVKKTFMDTVNDTILYKDEEIKESDLKEAAEGIAKWSKELEINPIVPMAIVMQEVGWANLNDSDTAKGYFQIEDRPGLRVDKDLFNRVSTMSSLKYRERIMSTLVE